MTRCYTSLPVVFVINAVVVQFLSFIHFGQSREKSVTWFSETIFKSNLDVFLLKIFGGTRNLSCITCAYRIYIVTRFVTDKILAKSRLFPIRIRWFTLEKLFAFEGQMNELIYNSGSILRSYREYYEETCRHATQFLSPSHWKLNVYYVGKFYVCAIALNFSAF